MKVKSNIPFHGRIYAKTTTVHKTMSPWTSVSEHAFLAMIWVMFLVGLTCYQLGKPIEAIFYTVCLFGISVYFPFMVCWVVPIKLFMMIRPLRWLWALLMGAMFVSVIVFAPVIPAYLTMKYPLLSDLLVLGSTYPDFPTHTPLLQLSAQLLTLSAPLSFAVPALMPLFFLFRTVPTKE